MTQQQFDDNGMIVNAPIKITYRDVETGSMQSEEVTYVQGIQIMIGKAEKNDMLQLPTAGWIKASAIQKFKSVVPQQKYIAPPQPTHDYKPRPLAEMGLEGIKNFLKSEIKRLDERVKLTGVTDPRTRTYREMERMETKSEILEKWRNLNNVS